MYSTKIPYEITKNRYENVDFILSSDHKSDDHIINILNDNNLYINSLNSIMTFIYEFKTPIIPKEIHCNIHSNVSNATQVLEIYYWDDINFQWILFKRIVRTGVPKLEINKINEIFDTDIKTTKINITVNSSYFVVYLCTLDYEAESKTVKSLVSSTITENELFQQLTVPSSIE